MSEPVQVLVVRAGGLSWALPMTSVEQAFHLKDYEVRHVGDVRVVRFRDEVLELVNLADRLGLESGEQPSAVVVWGSGRRFALTVDELTGLSNRRGLILGTTQLLQLADQRAAEVQVLVVDIRGVTGLNQRRGHEAGDAALLAVARALRVAFRRSDVVARLGGTRLAETILRRHRAGMVVAGTSAGAAVLSEHTISMGDSGGTPRRVSASSITSSW